MFGNNFNPYGFNPAINNSASMPDNNYYQPHYGMQYNQQPSLPATNTNKIFVNGLEDARNRKLLPNSDYIFLDNDQPLLYQKVVDGNGRFEMKVFEIIPHKAEPKRSNEPTDFVLKSEFLALQNELAALKERLSVMTVSKEVTNESVEQSNAEQ